MRARLGLFIALFCSYLAAAPRAHDLKPLFARAWQVADAVPKPPTGAMYIFLPNGTLLEASCTETYRIATWTIDKDNPSTLHVAEDGRLAFTAVITELSNLKLRLQQTLVRSGEKHSLTLKAVAGEFVCPDLHR